MQAIEIDVRAWIDDREREPTAFRVEQGCQEILDSLARCTVIWVPFVTGLRLADDPAEVPLPVCALRALARPRSSSP